MGEVDLVLEDLARRKAWLEDVDSELEIGKTNVEDDDG